MGGRWIMASSALELAAAQCLVVNVLTCGSTRLQYISESLSVARSAASPGGEFLAVGTQRGAVLVVDLRGHPASIVYQVGVGRWARLQACLLVAYLGACSL
jgi:hypothetical protein